MRLFEQGMSADVAFHLSERSDKFVAHETASIIPTRATTYLRTSSDANLRLRRCCLDIAGHNPRHPTSYRFASIAVCGRLRCPTLSQLRCGLSQQPRKLIGVFAETAYLFHRHPLLYCCRLCLCRYFVVSARLFTNCGLAIVIPKRSIEIT